MDIMAKLIATHNSRNKSFFYNREKKKKKICDVEICETSKVRYQILKSKLIVKHLQWKLKYKLSWKIDYQTN